jgi:hypothetical protein
LAVVELAILWALWVFDPMLCRKILAVMAAAFFGGRMPGILTGLESDRPAAPFARRFSVDFQWFMSHHGPPRGMSRVQPRSDWF